MMTNKTIVSTLVATALVTSMAANAAVVDFEDLSVVAGSNIIGGDYISGGYLFDSSTNHSHLINDNFDAYNGTTWLGWDDFDGNNVVTMSFGGTFSLNSLDITEFFGTPNSVTVGVVGNLFGGGTVSQTIVLDDIADGAGAINDFQTVLFSSSWTNLTSVTFDAHTGGGDRWFGIDNITVNESSVPEPSILALLGIGILGLGFTRKNKSV